MNHRCEEVVLFWKQLLSCLFVLMLSSSLKLLGYTPLASLMGATSEGSEYLRRGGAERLPVGPEERRQSFKKIMTKQRAMSTTGADPFGADQACSTEE